MLPLKVSVVEQCCAIADLSSSWRSLERQITAAFGGVVQGPIADTFSDEGVESFALKILYWLAVVGRCCHVGDRERLGIFSRVRLLPSWINFCNNDFEFFIAPFNFFFGWSYKVNAYELTNFLNSFNYKKFSLIFY